MKKLLDSIHCLVDSITNLQLDATEKNNIFSHLEEMKQQVNTQQQYITSLQQDIIYLKKAQDFYISAMNSLPNPIFIKNQDAQFVFFNNAYMDFFNMDATMYLNKSVLELDYLPLEDRKKFHEEDLHLIATGQVRHYDTTFEQANGVIGHSLYWSKGFTSLDNQTSGLVGEIVDISVQIQLKQQLEKSIHDLESANQKIKTMLNLDSLTNLYNRRMLDPSIQHSLKQRKNNIACCLLLADIDHFKSVNDTYGHAVGDDIIIDFSNILQNCCHSEDIIIRYGGEEFFIILEGTTLPEAIIVAENIRLQSQQQLVLPDQKTVTVSIGVTELLLDDTAQTCSIRADHALYHAKNNGRNQVSVL